MLHRHTLGKIPPKPHTAFYDEDGKLLMEQCVTYEGFNGPYVGMYATGSGEASSARAVFDWFDYSGTK